MLSRRAVAVAFVLVLAACASGGRTSRCAPIDPELYLDYGGLYDECTVEQRARVASRPRIEYPYRAPSNVVCLFAELKFIVDPMGRPIAETVQVTRANDQRYVDIVLNVLPQLRFTPGKVKGRAVHQYARWEARTAVRPSATTSRNPSTPNASC